MRTHGDTCDEIRRCAIEAMILLGYVSADFVSGRKRLSEETFAAITREFVDLDARFKQAMVASLPK